MSDGFTFHGQRKMEAGGEDHRYRINVLLIATKRPKYWEFHCMHCGQKVCELSGEIIYTSDVNDINTPADYKHQPPEYRCNGKYCKYYYSFTLG